MILFLIFGVPLSVRSPEAAEERRRRRGVEKDAFEESIQFLRKTSQARRGTGATPKDEDSTRIFTAALLQLQGKLTLFELKLTDNQYYFFNYLRQYHIDQRKRNG
jgi:hypothetical protein